MKKFFLLDMIKVRVKNRISLDKNNSNKINFSKNINMKQNSIEIKGKNNKLEVGANVELKNMSIKLNGNNNELIIKKGTKIKDTDIIIDDENNIIIISDDIRIYKSHFFINGRNSKIFVGKNTSIEGAKLNSQEDNNDIFIGEDCMFSYNIEIRNTDSHPIMNFENKLINKGKKVVIKDRVWLGEGVTVLKGVTIEENCVIGAKSLVTKSIKKKNSLSGGIPAKIIREEIRWERFFDSKEIK